MKSYLPNLKVRYCCLNLYCELGYCFQMVSWALLIEGYNRIDSFAFGVLHVFSIVSPGVWEKHQYVLSESKICSGQWRTEGLAFRKVTWKAIVAGAEGNKPCSAKSCKTKFRRCSSSLRWPFSLASDLGVCKGVCGVRGERPVWSADSSS